MAKINNNSGDVAEEKSRDAVVVAVYPSATGPYDASVVKYDVGINTKAGIVIFPKCVPAHRRPMVDVQPSQVGDPVIVTWCGSDMLLSFPGEHPWWGPCTGSTP